MVRLPTPGSDDGIWGTLLNEFLSVELQSNGTLNPNGSIASKANNDAVVHLTGTEEITGNKNFTGTLQRNGSAVVVTTDTRLTDQVGYYPPQGWGFFAMTAPSSAGGGVGSLSGGFFTRIWVPAGKAITGMAGFVTTAGTAGADTNNGFAIYDDDGVLVDTALSTAVWSVLGWRSVNFSTPIAAQSSGRFVYAACICNGYSPGPSIMYNTSGANVMYGGIGLGANKRHNIFSASTPSFPASFNPDSYGEINNYMPILGLL